MVSSWKVSDMERNVYVEYAGNRYRINRSVGDMVYVFKAVEYEKASGGNYWLWNHLCGKEGDREEKRLLERIAIESLGMTENKFVTILDGDPLKEEG